MSYVKEVQTVIDVGLNEEITIALYRLLTVRLYEVCGGIGTDEFRSRVAELHKIDRGYFREIIDGVCSEYPLPVEMNWRTLKYDHRRIGWCEICGNFFYDVSRNGRAMSCEGYCRKEYNRRKQIGGDVLSPNYVREIEIEFVDTSPSSDDKKGHDILNKMEMQRWGQFKTQTNMHDRGTASRKHDGERMAIRQEIIKEQPVITYHVSQLPKDSRLRKSSNFPHHLANLTLSERILINILKLGRNHTNRTLVHSNSRGEFPHIII